MRKQVSSTDTVIWLMFRILPVQILLAAVGAVNGIVSSYFASNYVGTHAMSAVGLYGPVTMLFSAVSTLLSGGSAILVGKYMGKNDQDRVQKVFSVNLLLSAGIACLFTVLLLLLGLLDLTGFLTQDALVRPLLNTYLIGQAIGVLPMILGNQLPVYLSLEDRPNLTLVASLVYIGINIVLNFLFVQVLHLEAFGLALASSLGMWIFLGVQASHFLSRKTKLHFRLKHVSWQEGKEIIQVGFPGAAASGYQTIRGIVVNKLLEAAVGTVAISAFAAANNLLGIFWAVPAGMLAVSRLMISIAVGEEDRQTLVDVTRNMFRRFVPIMLGICAVIILCAEPLTSLFFRDPSDPVYEMTVWGLRLLPLCMPLAIICTHFTCFSQTVGQKGLVHTVALLDGVICVTVLSALLVWPMGVNGVYLANVLNGVICVLVFACYAWRKHHRFPRSAGDWLVLPEGFGAGPDARIDISVRNMDEVLTVSKEVIAFCERRGIDGRRAYMAGLCLEEMAGNIVAHGFTKDRKDHRIDLRVVHKDENLILRIRDDCVSFDPRSRIEKANGAGRFRNIGIKMAYKAARNVEYQSILGLNVLTLKL